MERDPLLGADADGGKELLRATLSEQIAGDLRQKILYGSIPTGTLLSQRDLCERYGTSRMPVRDALRLLTHEGFLEPDRSGRAVVVVDDTTIEDSNAIVAVLHGFAAGRLARRGDGQVASQLDELNRVMRAAAGRGDFGEVAGRNWEFHRLINIAGGSPSLRAAMRVVSFRMPRDFARHFPETVGTSLREHDEIIGALRAGDEALSEQLTRDHVSRAFLEFRAERTSAMRAGQTARP